MKDRAQGRVSRTPNIVLLVMTSTSTKTISLTPVALNRPLRASVTLGSQECPWFGIQGLGLNLYLWDLKFRIFGVHGGFRLAGFSV